MGPTVQSSRCFGLLTYRPRWGLSCRGFVLLSLFAALLAAGLLFSIHPFLAVNDPVTADILVIEGWVPRETLLAAEDHCKNISYQWLIVTIPWQTNRTALPSAARHLLSLGVQESKIVDLYPKQADRRRTWQSALCLAAWLSQEGVKPLGVNILSEGVHARRSRLLFQHALGPGIKVGVIAGKTRYDASRWWTQSEGVKEVIAETIGYIYFKLTI